MFPAQNTQAMAGYAIQNSTDNNKKAKKRQNVLVADLFCGSGGFSTGAVRALDSLDIGVQALSCVNHWASAIETHTLNHPTARHFCQDLGAIRPIDAVPEGRLDLLLASPTCTYFSRARGGKPVSDQQRNDPFFLLIWLTELRVNRVIVENVPEIVDWGPVNVRTGRPLVSRKGEYFKAWISSIRNLGFKVDYKILNCADYGDATTRQRFFLIARSDRKPLAWPVQTHSRTGAGDLFGHGAQRWRGANEIIDWNKRGNSIYQRKRPLSAKTLLRVYSGLVRFDWDPGYVARLEQYMLSLNVPQDQIAEVRVRSRPKNARHREALRPTFILNRHGDNGSVRAHHVTEPMPTADCRGAGYLVEGPDTATATAFVATVSHGNISAADNTRRVRSLDDPLQTIHAGGGDFALVEPAFILSQASAGAPRDTDHPVPTIVSGGAHALIAPFYSNGSGRTCTSSQEPLGTITTRDRFGIAFPNAPLIAPFYGRTACKNTTDPVDTISSKSHLALVMPVTHGEGGNRVRETTDPLPTITGAHRGELGFITAAFGERGGQLPRTHDIASPVPTICAQGTINLVAASVEDNDYDILFRMLQPDELSRATSLCTKEKPYKYASTNKTSITKQIGNAVPCRTAEAIVRALFL